MHTARMLKFRWILVLIVLLTTVFQHANAQIRSEADVISRIARHWNCREEVSVQGGRADLVTATHAFEVERASKWKNSIGQSLWYGLQLNKKPGIILIIEDRSDYKYGIMLGSALQYAGLSDRIDVYHYPDDLNLSGSSGTSGRSSSSYGSSYKSPSTSTGSYWISSTGKRHNRGCRYYQNCKGRSGSSREGVACKICGG